ncbi:helix-turn-helix transcriptional regulator [Streptomyces sp. L-9-10]|uniref:helix-turn-helix domain-containing protein n=1 Tax=Streptomyces sp. L-9-10 TaxID=1478131 RepID=UPI00101C7945|nr:helix-turn-helix transcriptional regulator [Streptomyces sp. L-9-10]
MELNSDEDGKATPRTLLGRRLRRMRGDSGLSLRALAEQVGYPHSYLGRVELGDQLPSEALAIVLDRHFGTSGLFMDLLELAQDTSIPDYGRAIVSSEEQATRIQVFNSSLIPGLLQTEDYAHALIRETRSQDSEEQLSELVERRMRRKRVLAKDNPPLFWAIMDEAVLKRPMGGSKCMTEQISSVLEVARMPHVAVQVLPFTQGEHPLLGGSLSLQTFQNGATIAYVESFVSGESVESPKKILRLTQMFDTARSKALPEKESLALMRTYLGEYENAEDS